MKDAPGLTPMMRQYFEIKEQHKDHLVFFRLGDFYEMFFEDALTGSRELELTLTGRDCGLESRAPMCGVPHHSSETYIARLIKKGYKVAICEQVEDPAFAKGVVSREVVRVVTPGTLMEDNLLEEDKNNFLCCIFMGQGGYGLVFADISTGEMNVTELKSAGDDMLINELARYMPREVIFNPAFMDKTEIAKYMREKIFCTADLVEDSAFEYETAKGKIEAHFGKSLEDIGMGPGSLYVRAAGALLDYLYNTQKIGVERLISVNIVEESRYMALDAGARDNLELLQAVHTKEKRGSLLWAVDKTKTPMGKRLIKTWISQPLMSPPEIDKRLNAVEELYNGEILLGDVMGGLGGIFDIERLATRVVYGSATPREYKSLEQAAERFPALKSALMGCKSHMLSGICGDIDELADVKELISAAICEEPPASIKDGGVIRQGYNAELEALRELMSGAREYLAGMESSEREATGIRNLKIKFNKVFGYFIEITNSNIGQAPERYIRRQTLANCERYVTPELKELEERILTAGEKAAAIESRLFEELRRSVALELHRIQRTATAIARLDVLCSFARASLDNRYTRPEINLSGAIEIRDGRHPVVELLLDGFPFVPNDTYLDMGENRIAVITGPNMAGKSTYMRQVAIIALMAQTGCFVPASAARIGVVDGIYTRVGAADDLTSGLSTFMVEMREVAQILNRATSKSLLVLDEIGRGTSTYDGMSIARAVIEYIADAKKLGAKTLFSTHYHELTEMENDVPNVKNYNTAVKKRGDDITFLRKITRGGADGSYGIEVSKLAGIPDWIVKRARQVLEDLESEKPVRDARIKTGYVKKEDLPDETQITFAPRKSELDEALKALDLNTLTPIEALNALYRLKEKAR